MSIEIGPKSFEIAQRDTTYLRRIVRGDADAAASAHSFAATLRHVELAPAYEKGCGSADDQAWVAEHRAW